MNQFLEALTEFFEPLLERLEPLWAYLFQLDTLEQLVLIGALFIPAWLLSRVVEPRLEARVREIKGMPGVLRAVVAVLRRTELLFFVILLLLGRHAVDAFGWPANSYLLSIAGKLATSFLLISIVSQIIRRRTIRIFFAWSAWIFVAAEILGITDDVSEFLDSIGFDIAQGRISVLTVFKFLVVLGALLWGASTLGNLIDQRVQRVEELTPSLRVLLGKVIRFALIFLAGIVTLQSLNIDLTAFTVLSGAVGVGIGFGLQKVVSNFISGIIILLDESIKPGDTISLGETFGWIRELRARFVSVITRDGREFLIPNEDFITREVINWSFTDKFVRLDVNFGVAYDSDPHEVIRIAIEAASSVDRVDSERKKPVCWMTEFGDSSLNFRLRFWIDDPQQGLTNIRGKVLLALWDAFKAADIKIPFPHREVIFKNAPMPQD